MHRLLQRGFVVGVVGLLAGSARANLITNPSFEIGTGAAATDWTLLPTGAAATAGDYPTATNTSPYGPRFLTFNAGINTPGGSATQDIAALDGGTWYELSFAYGAIGTSGTQTLQITINATSAPIPGPMYVADAPSLDLAALWQRATYQFVGTLDQVPSGVTFADLGVTLTGDSDLVVDDVSLIAIPEPITLGWVGLAGLMLARRRAR